MFVRRGAGVMGEAVGSSAFLDATMTAPAAPPRTKVEEAGGPSRCQHGQSASRVRTITGLSRPRASSGWTPAKSGRRQSMTASALALGGAAPAGESQWYKNQMQSDGRWGATNCFAHHCCVSHTTVVFRTPVLCFAHHCCVSPVGRDKVSRTLARTPLLFVLQDGVSLHDVLRD